MSKGSQQNEVEVGLVKVRDGSETWVFDASFFGSAWQCIWDSGCVGIEAYDATTQRTGCCSVGVELEDEDEAMLIAALAACIDPLRFAKHEAAADVGIFADSERRFTRVVDGACIFFNPVDATAPTGCALHIEAQAQSESPLEWKPAVCSQVPVRIDTHARGSQTEHLVRAWTRSDWGEEGSEMLWWCTERNQRPGLPDAFRAETPVALRLQPEISAMTSPRVAAELVERIGEMLQPNTRPPGNLGGHQ